MKNLPLEVSSVYQNIVVPTLERARDTIPFFEIGDHLEQLVLYGAPGAVLDSLNLVTFVFMIEEEVASKFGRNIRITTQDVLDTDRVPFASLDNLAEFLLRKMEEPGKSRD